MITTNTAPLIAIALMIKNEESSIRSTLKSLSQDGIKNIFILDTGSTDDTVNIVIDFFNKNELSGYIIQEPFIDFSTSRNRTLELAEQHFPDARFLLMPDAEWHLHNASHLLEFCDKEKDSGIPLYLLNIKMNGMEFSAARLFRANNRVRFKGVVHEVPDIIANVKVSAQVYFEVNATSRGIEKSQRRWKQDLILLSNEYLKNPLDPRNIFYLAQTFECLGDLETAYVYYQYRSNISGWNEENYITLIRLGNLAALIEDWSVALDYYLKAFACRSHRIESLIKIADHYWPENIPACYLFIKHAYYIAYPLNDLLFIDKEAYIYTRYEIMSRCAWHVGDYSLGEEATRMALKAHPGTKHLLNNLEVYQQKLKSD